MKICEHFGGNLSVWEGDKLVQRFECRHDTRRALGLLRQLNSLKTADGTPIHAFYRHRGFYLWPFFQDYLIGQVCIPWARYGHVIEWLGNRDAICDHEGLDTFAPLLETLRGGPRRPWQKKVLFGTLLHMARRRSRPHELAFYDLMDDDFRSKSIRAILEELHQPYSRFRRFETRRDWKTSFWGTEHIPWSITLGVEHGTVLPLAPDTKTDWPEWALDRIFAWVDGMVQQAAREIDALIEMWKDHRPRLIYGIDECAAPNPIWAVARFHGIPTVGHQHGSYNKLMAGWMRYGIPHEYNNVRFNRLLVWGDYWKKKLLQYTSLFEEREIEIACPMRPLPQYAVNRESCRVSRSESSRRSILIPYEFLADQPAVGKYMDLMIKKGWHVMLKTRPDEPIAGQLASYELQQPEKVGIVEELSGELLSTMDAAAGTMTTLLYELLPYRIPIWYLETGFTMLEDMVADGLAHLVTLEILERAPPELFEPRYQGDGSEFINPSQTLKGVMGGLIQQYL